jgi:hypothetical protein
LRAARPGQDGGGEVSVSGIPAEFTGYSSSLDLREELKMIGVE